MLAQLEELFRKAVEGFQQQEGFRGVLVVG